MGLKIILDVFIVNDDHVMFSLVFGNYIVMWLSFSQHYDSVGRRGDYCERVLSGIVDLLDQDCEDQLVDFILFVLHVVGAHLEIHIFRIWFLVRIGYVHLESV